MPRTFVIGDIHGDLEQLNTLLERLPSRTDEDTLVFLGDYIDRGTDSAGVVARVRELQAASPKNVVALRGNHEDKWVACLEEADPAFLITVANGCGQTFRSFTGKQLPEGDSLPFSEFERFLDVKSWFPEDVAAWMAALPVFYEDEHAIYVHAGLDGEGSEWKHPSAGAEKPLLWMREPDFYSGYHGKRVVFGHTPTTELPVDHIGPIRKIFDDPGDVWTRNDLVGIDTGCGKGGFLSAVELPRMKVYESR